MIDVIHEINAAGRQVGTRVLEAGQARTITVTRVYAAAVEDVWDACTNPERIPRWFLPISGELREGGRYQLQGNASGRIQRCSAPHGFAATWENGGDVSWIELRLVPEAGGRTRLELEHIAHVDDALWTQFGPGAVGVGWELALMGLTGHLGPGKTVEPDEAEAWSASDEGRQFMRLSSEAWGEASIAADTEPSMARAAAERTTAFYTGTPAQSGLA
jgi:uncharacterized protein YndB with AHSA1/START domain